MSFLENNADEYILCMQCLNKSMGSSMQEFWNFLVLCFNVLIKLQVLQHIEFVLIRAKTFDDNFCNTT